MTAAHVVHDMDEILVEFLGGEMVPARVIASEPAADLSLLRLGRIPMLGPAGSTRAIPTRSGWGSRWW
jgi:S1-C subfamily serine protease